jgi:ATP-binding cassette subfamily C (CFTR/MRP) protein 1
MYKVPPLELDLNLSSRMAVCRDSEGWDAVSRLREFDITPCFEEGVIISSLLSVIFILTLLRTITIYFNQSLERSHKSIQILSIKLVASFFLAHITNFHSCFQQVLLGAALIVSIANVLFTIFHPNNPVPVLYSYFLEPFALTSILIFTYFNHTRTRSSSTLLLIFWPLYIAAITAWIRTVLSRDLDRFLVILSLKCATLGLAAVAFGFECKGPEFEDNFDSPILTANVYSIWVTILINNHRNGVIIILQSFSWMSPLVKKGAIQFITEDDLPPLKPTDESYNLGEDLKQALKNR